MGSNARRLMERRFSMATMVDRYEQLFANLHSSADGPAGAHLATGP
jgi:hypothetical protein